MIWLGNVVVVAFYSVSLFHILTIIWILLASLTLSRCAYASFLTLLSSGHLGPVDCTLHLLQQNAKERLLGSSARQARLADAVVALNTCRLY